MRTFQETFIFSVDFSFHLMLTLIPCTALGQGKKSLFFHGHAL